MTFLQIAIGAARLESRSLRVDRGDRTATGQALLIVVLSTAAAGIGLTAGDAPVVHRVMLALFFWGVWANRHLYRWRVPHAGTADRHECRRLLRTIGSARRPACFASSGSFR